MKMKSIVNKQSKNFSEIMMLYSGRCEDLTIYGNSRIHYHCHIHVGIETISVVQEPYYDGTNNLEYAILYGGDLIQLEEHGDSVARYQTLEQVIEVIEKSISEDSKKGIRSE